MAGRTPTPKLFIQNGHTNSVLNRFREPEKELSLYAEAFWNSAKRLLENDQLDKRFGFGSFDASVIVYLYRHALELFLKGILIGRGGEFLAVPLSPEEVLNANHSLTKLLPNVRLVFAAVGWVEAFGSGSVRTFDDFTRIVEELEGADPSSFSFRYPIKKR
jgi:hypothetical protein